MCTHAHTHTHTHPYIYIMPESACCPTPSAGSVWICHCCSVFLWSLILLWTSGQGPSLTWALTWFCFTPFGPIPHPVPPAKTPPGNGRPAFLPCLCPALCGQVGGEVQSLRSQVPENNILCHRSCKLKCHSFAFKILAIFCPHWCGSVY